MFFFTYIFLLTYINNDIGIIINPNNVFIYKLI